VAAVRVLQVDVNVGARPAVALGDARLAERLVANLVGNAIRHNVSGGWISAGRRARRAAPLPAAGGHVD
jgi:signal transduction histidine kinase